MTQPSGPPYAWPPLHGAAATTRSANPLAAVLLCTATVPWIVLGIVNGITSPNRDGTDTIAVGSGSAPVVLPLAGVFIALAVVAGLGHRWARITVTIMGGIFVLLGSSAIVVTPLVLAAEPAFIAVTSATGIGTAALTVIGIVLLRRRR